MFVHVTMTIDEEYVYPFEKVLRSEDKIAFIPRGFTGDVEEFLESSTLKFNTKQDAKKVFELAICFMNAEGGYNASVFEVDLDNYFSYMKYVRAKLDAIKKG